MEGVIVVVRKGFECAEECTNEELRVQVSATLNGICSELGMDEGIFFEIMESLSVYSNENEKGIMQIRTYPKLSANTLKIYQRTGFPNKYVFRGHKSVLRAIKRAVALYIGRDVEDTSSDMRGAIVDQYARCINLDKNHLRNVEENWRNKKTAFEAKLFECYEAARRNLYPREEMEKVKKQLEDASTVMDFFERISNESEHDVLNPLIIHSDEHAALASVFQQLPRIKDILQDYQNDLNNQYIEYVLAKPRGAYRE